MRKIEFDFSHKTNALKHQIEAIEFIKKNKNTPLFDEQGLGKSKIVIDALIENIKNGEIDCVLVICEKGLLNTWKKEVEKHSFLMATVLSNTSTYSRGRRFLQFSQFYIINYESLIQEIERIKMFLKLRKFAIVLDESQKIKNPHSKITQKIFEIKDLCIKKIIVTGTPISNKPEDLWSQFFFLDGGETLGKDFKAFQKRVDIKLKGKQSLEAYEDSLRAIQNRINKISIRRTKDVLELPEKIYKENYVTLSGKQKETYEQVKKELYLEIKNADGKDVIEKIDNYLVKLLRLTQVASNPLLIDDSYDQVPAKFLALDKLVEGIMNKSEKVIIWSSFRKNIRLLRNRYKNFGSLMIFGEIPIAERNEIVEKFTENEENKVLIANPAAAGVGLTLISASNAIYLDRNFKMDEYVQSQDRIHRIGQTKKCNIIRIMALGTIDMYIDEIIEKKDILARFTLGDIKTLKTPRQFLTKEDLLKILG